MHISMKRKAALAFVLSAALALTLFPVSAGAVTAAQKQAEVQSVSAQLNALNEELSLAVDDYNLANRNHDQAVAEAEDCQQRINDAQAKINALQTRIETRATSMYRSGSMTYLDVLMGVGSFDVFATVWDTLNTLNAEDADLVVSSKQAKAELDAAKADLDAKQAEAQRQLEIAESYKSEIESKTAQYQSIYNGLSSEYQELLAQEQAAQEQAAAAASAAYFPSVSSSSSSGGGSSSKGSSSTRPRATLGGSSAVERAYSAIGLPYVYGASSPSAFDCSGLVSWALTGSFGHAYVSQDFWSMPEVSDPQPGDVVACHAGHCGLYIGNGQMIEAPHTGATVRISSVRGKIVRP